MVDVQAPTHEAAARRVADLLTRGGDSDLLRHPDIDCFWFPEPHDKHIDVNDRHPMTLRVIEPHDPTTQPVCPCGTRLPSLDPDDYPTAREMYVANPYVVHAVHAAHRVPRESTPAALTPAIGTLQDVADRYPSALFDPTCPAPSVLIDTTTGHQIVVTDWDTHDPAMTFVIGIYADTDAGRCEPLDLIETATAQAAANAVRQFHRRARCGQYDAPAAPGND